LFKRLQSFFSGFRGRLLSVVSVGIISLALIASITSALLSGDYAAEQMVAQGLKTTEFFAEQSLLSLIYESEENALKPLENILAYPDVIQAGIFFPDGKSLIGSEGLIFPMSSDYEPTKSAWVHQETSTSWYLIAPVVISSKADGFMGDELMSPEDELLGYAYLVMSKESLRDLQISMILNNLLVALTFAVLLNLLVNLGIDRMLKPFYRLIDIMKVNEQEKTRVYAEVSGPKEIMLMGKVFNRMLESLEERDRQLREHGQQLEVMVQIRTRELVTARDSALSASRQKTEFLANMSHELRTPLQAIIGYSEVVKEEMELDGNDDQVDSLERINRNATRLLSLINSILDMSKIESGKMDLNLIKTDMRDVLKEAVETIHPILVANGNKFFAETEIESEQFDIDREKLLQIIINLLSNAAKFTENGTVTLKTYLTSKILQIAVIDTGIGLTDQDMGLIFEEFRQADGSASRRFEGTGLGLAISRRFAQQMGGDITVTSKKDHGSTFTMTLPLPIGDKQQVADLEDDPTTPSLVNL